MQSTMRSSVELQLSYDQSAPLAYHKVALWLSPGVGDTAQSQEEEERESRTKSAKMK